MKFIVKRLFLSLNIYRLKAGKYRYISLAQDLVMAARGKLKERNWKRSNGSPATIDDISVFVIPILPYKEEYLNLKVIVT